jgi:hypothetical protein
VTGSPEAEDKVMASNEKPTSNSSTLRDLISMLASIAGKRKDEIVQMISREIGQAVAGVIKEPILRILEDQKLEITVELVNKKRGAEKVAIKAKRTKNKK